MNDVLFIILMALIFLVVIIFVPRWMLLRTIPKVIRIFRQHNAVGGKNAKTIEELGLMPKSFYQKMLSRRDYKPQALQILLKAGIVEMTEEGKVYLVEENLIRSRWSTL